MARKTVTDAEGREFLFRVPTVKDFWIVRGELPIPDEALTAMAAKRRKGKKTKADPDDMKQSLALLDLADALLLRCCIRPKLLTETVEDVPEGAVCLEELDPLWRMGLFAELAAEAGLDDAATAAGK